MDLKLLHLGIVAASERLGRVRGVPEGGVRVKGAVQSLGGCLSRGRDGGVGGLVDFGAALRDEREARGGGEG